MFQDFVQLSLKSKQIDTKLQYELLFTFHSSKIQHGVQTCLVKFLFRHFKQEIYSMYFKITSVYRCYLQAARCLRFQINTNLKENNEKSDFSNMMESKIQICICLDLTDCARFFWQAGQFRLGKSVKSKISVNLNLEIPAFLNYKISSKCHEQSEAQKLR